MTQQNYTATTLADQSPDEAFDAIRNVRGWWSERITGSPEKVGDEFRYHYQDLHKCIMKLVELAAASQQACCRAERIAWRLS